MAKQSSGGGLSFMGALGILFITLKLCGVIDWEWWLVLLPLYGLLAIGLAIMVLGFGFAGLLYSVAGVVGLFQQAWRKNN